MHDESDCSDEDAATPLPAAAAAAAAALHTDATTTDSSTRKHKSTKKPDSKARNALGEWRTDDSAVAIRACHVHVLTDDMLEM
jgi:hypothetical protein